MSVSDTIKCQEGIDVQWKKLILKRKSKKNVMALQVIKEQEVLGKQFKIYGTFEEPLFLAKDVAEWIDYSRNPNGTYQTQKMLKTVDEDEKIKLLCDSNIVTTSDVCDITISNTTSQARKTQEMWFLTEDGLYEVLMQSRKPIAKAFKKEVKQIGSLNTKLPKIKSQRGVFTVIDKDGNEHIYNQRGVGLFTTRAVLRVGMLHLIKLLNVMPY